MKRTLTLLFLLALLVADVSARRVGKDEARRIAAEFLKKNNNADKSLRMLSPSADVAGRMMLLSGTERPFYVFNVGAEDGFVIVAGDDAAGSVLGYADKGTFSMDGAPDNLAAMMDMMAAYVRYAAENGVEPVMVEKGEPVIAPLLGNIQWNQMYPYNTKCPTYKDEVGNDAHYPTGCVVTAISQIMRYHKFPVKGNGKGSYYFRGEELTADYGNTEYKWDDMLEQYSPDVTATENIDAVATLMAHMGVATQMQYDINGSGTYDPYVPEALLNHFGYDKGMSLKYRNYYVSDEWMKMLTDELDQNRPVYYGGQCTDGMGGHAFVCDGYDTNGFVHINWGWGGNSDGWFSINHLDPEKLGTGGGAGGFNLSQSMLLGIQPARQDTEEDVWPMYSVVGVNLTFYSKDISVFMDVTSQRAKEFDGSMGLALMQDGSIVKVIDEQPLKLQAFPSKQNTSWYQNRNISRTTDVADGTYTIMPIFRDKDSDVWNIIRCYVGTPRECPVTVEGGFISGEDTRKRTPNVDLLTKIVPQTPVFVGGYGKYNLTVRVNDKDNCVQNMSLVFTNVDDKNVADTISSFISVYDGCTEDVSIMGKLSDDLEPGMYYVDAYSRYHMDNENDKFNDSEVGRTIIEVLPPSEYPVLGLASPALFIDGNGNPEDVREAETLITSADIINYATAGSTSVIMYLVDKNDPSVRYVNVMANEEFSADGKAKHVLFYNPLGVNVPPGEYYMDFKALCGKDTLDVISEFEPTEISILENNDCVLHCDKIEGLPSVLELGASYDPVFTVTANQDYKGQIKFGICEFDHMGGEPILFEFSADMKAGETKEFKSKYGYKPSPELEGNFYLVYAQYKSKGAKKLKPMTGAANYYKMIYFGVVTDIDEIKPGADIVVDYKDGRISVHGRGVDILNTEIYSVDGSRISSAQLVEGVYILRITTSSGIIVRKIRI